MPQWYACGFGRFSPENAGAQVVSGGIRNALSVAVMGSSSNSLLVGGGGPLVELSTQSGSISIE